MKGEQEKKEGRKELLVMVVKSKDVLEYRYR